MKLLDHTKDENGYCLRFWLDELGPEEIRTFNWGLEPPEGVSIADYEISQLDEATALVRLELTTPVTTTIDSDDKAIKEQEQAVIEAKAAADAIDGEGD